MNLVEMLDHSREAIIDEATDGLSRVSLKHYEESGVAQNRRRLSRLFDLARECIARRDLMPIVEHAQAIARERYRDGYDLREVQTAFNVLEEEIWKHITAALDPSDYPEAFGLASTVLGAGKQALAVEYVSLASHRTGIESLDLTALFTGG